MARAPSVFWILGPPVFCASWHNKFTCNCVLWAGPKLILGSVTMSKSVFRTTSTLNFLGQAKRTSSLDTATRCNWKTTNHYRGGEGELRSTVKRHTGENIYVYYMYVYHHPHTLISCPYPPHIPTSPNAAPHLLWCLTLFCWF
jgi:hypothetical protein